MVNDLGAEVDGTGSSDGPAGEVVGEIRAFGAEAIANGEDISDWDGAKRLIDSAVDDFRRPRRPGQQRRDPAGPDARQHDRRRVRRGHPGPPPGDVRPDAMGGRVLAQPGQGGRDQRRPDHQHHSPSGIYGNVGQTNYGAAKAGIASMTVITAMELARYGVTVNAIAPAALTRMTENLGSAESSAQRSPTSSTATTRTTSPPWWSGWAAPPRPASPAGSSTSTGGHISVAEGWVEGPSADKDDRWEVGEIGDVLPGLVAKAAPNANMMGRRDQ